jgi:tRNA-modifying protein YgfZ
MSAVLVESGLDVGAIWHFGEPNQEQRALALGNAWADLSHRAVISIAGKDRTTWINNMMTQELLTLPTGEWSETLLLDAQGHIEQQLFLVDDGESIWMHTEASKAPELIAYLNKMKFMLDVDVQDRSAEFAVLRAPGAADKFGGPFALVLARNFRPSLLHIRVQDMCKLVCGRWKPNASQRVGRGFC